MPKKQRKYNIEVELGKLPRTVTLKKVIDLLDKYNINRKMFYRDRSIELNAEQDIPVERLLIYAKVFGCELSDLINYKVKAKPITKVPRINSPLS